MEDSGDFYGRPTRSLGNDHLRLEYLAHGGPRIVRLMLGDSPENLLVELPQLSWQTPHGEFFIGGGHRLWHAPEAFPRTYMPDNEGLAVLATPDGLRLMMPADPAGIAKSLIIRLDPTRAALTLEHTIENHGYWPITLAPWAITMLPPGGVAILPQPPGGSQTENLLPNRHMALWAYTRWDDPRLQLFDDYILIQGQPIMPPIKLGYFNRQGWLGYLRNGVLFRKRFTPLEDQPHPDGGCNSECFGHELFVEVETLGPLQTLDPGQATSHSEHWDVQRLDVPSTIEGVRQALAAAAP